MESWYTIVRTLQDESEKPRMTKEFVNRVLQDLKHLRIREKNKFRERTGVEFASWTQQLEDEYPPSLVREIVNDDEFWVATLQVSRF